MHWSKRKRLAEQWHYIVRDALKKAGVPKNVFHKPAEVCIYVNSRMDRDNHSYLLKLIIDGLKGHVIEDDLRKYVRRTSIELYGGKDILVSVQEV